MSYHPHSLISTIGLLCLLPFTVFGKSTDPNLVCTGDVPGFAAGWPPGYATWEYASNEDLCSSTGLSNDDGSSRNVGCSCPGPGDPLNCNRDDADPVLRGASLSPAGSPFSSFLEACYFNCQCSPRDTSTYDGSYHRAVEGYMSRGEALNRDDTANIASAIDEITNLVQQSESTSGWRPNDAEVSQVCGTRCTGNSQCSSDGCECQAKSSFINIATGDYSFVSACALIVGFGSGGKRSEQVPCVCNETYVSHGCCGTNGMIWEDSNLKLGELAAEDRSL